jgi:hypothetical protein
MIRLRLCGGLLVRRDQAVEVAADFIADGEGGDADAAEAGGDLANRVEIVEGVAAPLVLGALVGPEGVEGFCEVGGVGVDGGIVVDIGAEAGDEGTDGGVLAGLVGLVDLGVILVDGQAELFGGDIEGVGGGQLDAGITATPGRDSDTSMDPALRDARGLWQGGATICAHGLRAKRQYWAPIGRCSRRGSSGRRAARGRGKMKKKRVVRPRKPARQAQRARR